MRLDRTRTIKKGTDIYSFLIGLAKILQLHFQGLDSMNSFVAKLPLLVLPCHIFSTIGCNAESDSSPKYDWVELENDTSPNVYTNRLAKILIGCIGWPAFSGYALGQPRRRGPDRSPIRIRDVHIRGFVELIQELDRISWCQQVEAVVADDLLSLTPTARNSQRFKRFGAQPRWRRCTQFFASSAFTALRSSFESGSVWGLNRAATSPSRPTKNFSKFQPTFPAPLGLVSSDVRCL